MAMQDGACGVCDPLRFSMNLKTERASPIPRFGWADALSSTLSWVAEMLPSSITLLVSLEMTSPMGMVSYVSSSLSRPLRTDRCT